MRILTPALLVIATSLFAVACAKTDIATNQTRPAASGASPASSTLDEFAAVRAIFKKDCASCHADDGKGGAVKLDDGSMLRVPSLREGHAVKHNDEELVRQITDGGDGMPKFEDKLSLEQISDLMRFIRKEFQGR
jgi:mono/diheme cytochrome c family protein